MALTAKGLNFDETKLGGQHAKHAVATWNHLKICLRREENQENPCRDGRCTTLRMYTNF
jgi:hypothetical protein